VLLGCEDICEQMHARCDARLDSSLIYNMLLYAYYLFDLSMFPVAGLRSANVVEWLGPAKELAYGFHRALS
jgi:hypothetical protein